jgi:hypothetical protein
MVASQQLKTIPKPGCGADYDPTDPTDDFLHFLVAKSADSIMLS